MRVLAILPEFIPLEDVKNTVSQILPGTEVRTDASFERDDADVLIVTTFTPVDRSLVQRLPNLKFVQVASTGYDNVDVEYLKEKGIILSNIPVANKQSVAEHVIAMVLAFLKDLFTMDQILRSGHWPVLTGSRDLEGKTFGIVGMGMIGKQLAIRLLSFNPNIVYYDVKRLSREEEEKLGVTFMEFDELLKISDIISLHLPLNENTRKMFKEREFSLMKDGAIFINTSRAEIVDENALINAIKRKGLRAGIDVYPKEPPDFTSELFKLENTIFSPHIAGVTIESQQRFLTETIANVLRYIQGLEPLYRVL
ncbi:MAG: 2-hydroxyacid dehydrogenase [Thermoplasmata archaeon]|jgi:D-3-phosphoglycerate dehydrogenase|nr:hydroxyacid dehydrogenase [Euryarchaeota archaeon]MVT14486.1 hydroxyacid dehydrogenase [Euryarchaeota archaeon]MVT36325.1 hydroxyacid dehydrogenase [Euryarchaeota archaeon]